MHQNSHHTSPLIAGVLLLCALALSGCAGAVVGVGTAAVAASTTEKGFSTSVSDGVIFAKLKDRFIQVNASLLTSADVTVNDGAVLFTGKVKTPEDKIQATRLAWEIKGVREVVNELQVTDTSSIKDIAKDLAASATLRGKMIADKDISSTQIEVKALQCNIILLGLVSSADDISKAVGHAKAVEGVRSVKSFLKVQ